MPASKYKKESLPPFSLKTDRKQHFFVSLVAVAANALAFTKHGSCNVVCCLGCSIREHNCEAGARPSHRGSNTWHRHHQVRRLKLLEYCNGVIDRVLAMPFLYM